VVGSQLDAAPCCVGIRVFNYTVKEKQGFTPDRQKCNNFFLFLLKTAFCVCYVALSHRLLVLIGTLDSRSSLLRGG